MSDLNSPTSPLDIMRSRIGSDWPAIRKARQNTLLRRNHLFDLFRTRDSPDTTLAIFGSVARQEVISSSDLDWILLIDGQSIPEHKEQEREIEKTLSKAKYIEPGRSGIFGKMVGSHDLVHNIGGEDDLNSNTTRRVLLLLESLPIGGREAYDRVRRQILRRYLEDDRGLRYSSGDVRIPRFLLNDLTRYWRTVTVDFVYKQRAENDKKWALRNAKLRMSRKLVFAAGLLHCFFCHLDPAAEDARRRLQAPARDLSSLIEYIEQQLSLTPLDIVAKACLLQAVRDDTIRSIFDPYDQFLAILDDEAKRSELERAQNHEDLRNSRVWEEVRAVSRLFHKGLVSLFVGDNEGLRDLTMTYGLFYLMRPIGFSTGALARGDFQRALNLLDSLDIRVVELSALRISELEPLCVALPRLDLCRFEFVSVHAPSRISLEAESWVLERLMALGRSGFPIVVHPDTIYTPNAWRQLGEKLVIENMDKRKPIGRTVSEMRTIFDALPDARFCFDIGHARQVDPTMTEASLLLGAFAERLEEVHMSEVNTASRHNPISPNAVKAFQSVATYIPETTPIILETLIDLGQSDACTEITRARQALRDQVSAAA